MLQNTDKRPLIERNKTPSDVTLNVVQSEFTEDNKRDSKTKNITSFNISSLFSGKRWKLEMQIFWKNRIVFVICVAIQFLHSTATNIAYYRHVQLPALRDIGFEYIRPLNEDHRWISEFITFFTIISIILVSLVPFFQTRPYYYLSQLWLRALFTMAISIFLRCVSFLSTSLPGPASHCQPNSSEYHPPENMYDMLFKVDAFKGCGDLIFSSHTLISFSFILCFHYYGKKVFSFNVMYYYFLNYCIYWPCIIILPVLIISARKHYTVDVVIALYVTPLVFYTSLRIRPDQPTPELRKEFNYLV